MTREECIERVKSVTLIGELSLLGFERGEAKECVTEDAVECSVWRHTEHKILIVVEHMGVYGCNVISIRDLEDCMHIGESACTPSETELHRFKRGIFVRVGLALFTVMFAIGCIAFSELTSSTQKLRAVEYRCVVSDMRMDVGSDNFVSNYSVTLFSVDKERPETLNAYVSRNEYDSLHVGETVSVSIVDTSSKYRRVSINKM